MLARRRQIFEVIVTACPVDEIRFVVAVKRPAGVGVVVESFEREM
ncbi:MAG TPA: hypothetical protein VHR47_09590 [Bacillota bacterium]|nr:hypothetical protein [Bacillota bacterium]